MVTAKSAIGAALLVSVGTVWAGDGTWANANAGGNWADTASWLDGIIPDNGGTAYLTVNNDVVNLDGSSSRVGALVFQGSGMAVLQGSGPLTFVNDARIEVQSTGSLQFNSNTAASTGDVTVTGPGMALLFAPQAFGGKFVIRDGWVRMWDDTALGPMPATLVPDAITLDGGSLQNGQGGAVSTVAATRGIYVTERGGYAGAGYHAAALQIEAPITGPGAMNFNHEFSPVRLANPANDWRGDTLVGTVGLGGNPDSDAQLELLADEVIPHGEGRGRLFLAPWAFECNNGTPYYDYPKALSVYLRLKGHTETVNALYGGNRANITSDGPEGSSSRLVLAGSDDSNFRGYIQSGVTVVKNGSGLFDLTYGRLNAGAKFELNAGRLEVAPNAAAAGAQVVCNGGALAMKPFAGWSRFDGTTASDALAFRTVEGYPSAGRASTAVGSRSVYRAVWTLPAAGTYSFLKSYAGRATLQIDGTTILDDAAADTTRVVVNDVALAAGPHTVEMSFSPAKDGAVVDDGVFLGLMYDSANGAFDSNEERARARFFSTDFGDDFRAADAQAAYEGGLHILVDTTLTVDPLVGNCVLAGPVSAENGAALTVDCNGPVFVGSPDADHAAVLDAPIMAANGLVLTNHVWLLSAPPSNATLAPGAILTYDYPNAFAGDVELRDASLRVTTEGLGDGTITIYEGQTFRFDTQDYDGGTIVDPATGTRTYANDIVLAGGTLEFAGNGTITYTGTITGTGLIVKTGSGTALFNGDARALTAETMIRCDMGRFLTSSAEVLGTATICTNAGRFGVPADVDATFPPTTKFVIASGGFEVGANSRLTITGFMEGVSPCSLWGLGTLAIAGEGEDNTFSIHVRGGTLELAKSGAVAAVRGVQGLEPDSVVRITGSSTKMLRDGYMLLGGGTFDVNGHDIALSRLADCEAIDSRKGGNVVNNGSQAATVTVADTENLTLHGTFPAGTAPLTIEKTGPATWTLDAPVVANEAFTFTGGRTIVIGHGLATVRYVRFTCLAARPQGAHAGSGMQFSEIRFLDDGTEVAIPAGATVSARSESGAHESGAKIIDGENSKWYAPNLDGAVATIDFGEAISFDAYQLRTANDAEGRDPYSWKIEISSDGENWAVVDTETEVALTTARLTWDDHVFPIAAPSDVFPSTTAVSVASSASVTLRNVEETFERLTGQGQLALDGSSVFFVDETAFTGTVSGAGTVTVATEAPTYAAFSVGRDVTVKADGTATSLGPVAGQSAVIAGLLADGTAPLGIQVNAPGAELVLSATDSAFTGGTRVEEGRLSLRSSLSARYFRFTVMKTTRGSDTTYAQLSRIDLICDGDVRAWPEGSTATSEGDSGFKNEGAQQLLDGNANTKCFWGGLAYPVLITCPVDVTFDGYDWYTANDSVEHNRQPVSWKLEYSADGVNWILFDEQIDNPTTPTVQNYELAYTYSASVQNLDALPDDDVVAVGSNGVFAVVGVRETFGGLSGDGAFELGGAGSVATLAPTGDAFFTGSVSGAGTLVKAGEGRQALSGDVYYDGTLVVEAGVLDLAGATLAGVTNIVLRGGTLVGAATVSGDLSVSSEGGAFGAELTVDGQLTLTGDMRLSVGDTRVASRRTGFTCTATDQASQNVFRNATLVEELPKSWGFSHFVRGLTMVYGIAPNVTVLFLR